MDTSDLTHLLPGLRMMVFHKLGDITVAEKIAQEAIGRGILAMAQGEVRGVRVEDFITRIAEEIIAKETTDRNR